MTRSIANPPEKYIKVDNKIFLSKNTTEWLGQENRINHTKNVLKENWDRDFYAVVEGTYMYGF